VHAPPPGTDSRLGCNPSCVTLMQQALGVSLAAERSAAARAIGSADPDLSLIEGIAAGRREALGLLYQRHAAALFRFIVQRLAGDAPLAEEVLQDVMLAVWQGAAGFRGDSRLLTWLFGIAHRQAASGRDSCGASWRRTCRRAPLTDSFRLPSSGPTQLPSVPPWPPCLTTCAPPSSSPWWRA